MCHYMCCYTSKIPKHLKAIQSTKLSNDWGPTASALWEALSALAESKELGFPPAWMQINIYCEGNSFCSFFVIFMQQCSSQVPSRMMDQNYWPSNSSLPYWFWDLNILNKNIIFWTCLRNYCFLDHPDCMFVSLTLIVVPLTFGSFKSHWIPSWGIFGSWGAAFWGSGHMEGLQIVWRLFEEIIRDLKRCEAVKRRDVVRCAVQ